jgi:hypothetical protein
MLHFKYKVKESLKELKTSEYHHLHEASNNIEQ